MKFLNKSRFKSYCSEVGCTLSPGTASRSVSKLKDFVDSLLKYRKSQGIILEEDDFKSLKELFDEHFSSATIDPSALSALGKRTTEAEAYEAFKKAKGAQVRAFSKMLEERRERNRRIQAESNMLDESGNPINDKNMTDAQLKDIKPEYHDETSTNIDDIIANNLAITKNLPKPDNVIMAQKNGTEVPHDPKFYQAMANKLPPGVPDVPGALDQYKSAQTEWKNQVGAPKF